MQCTFVVPELPAAVVVAPVNSEGYFKKIRKRKGKKFLNQSTGFL